MALVEPEPDGLTGFRVEIALALDDQLTGRRIDIEDGRIAEMFDDRDGAGEGGMRIVRVDDSKMLRPHAEFGRPGGGAFPYANFGHSAAGQNHALASPARPLVTD